MSAPFFDSAEKILRLEAEARGWIGTPFRDGVGPRARKGVAADCVSWIAATLQACGAIGAVPWPDRYVSLGGAEMLGVLIDTLNRTERLRCVWLRDGIAPSPMPPLLPGDILCGTRGRAGHHLALHLGGNVLLHSWEGRVREGNSKDSALTRHVHSIWRPIS